MRLEGESPGTSTHLTSIEAVALVNEACGVSPASQGFAAEDCLPSVAVAGPLVQNENLREIRNITNPL
jgi:hypothetical protein